MDMTLSDAWPSEAPSPREYSYMAFKMRGTEILSMGSGVVITEDEAIARFQRKYGSPPAYKVTRWGYFWLGPEVRAE